jgi:hypothetical protein
VNRRKPFTKFQNIRVTPDGYQVVVTRSKIETRKFFAGHSEKSLKAAEQYRNKLLKKLPSKRKNPVPSGIWSAVGLSEPAIGVFRNAERKQYNVAYKDKEGRQHSRAFSWRGREEEVAAYAQAVSFRKKIVKGAA